MSKIFEKAKIALRKYVLENKDKVDKDLEEMRKRSTGNDIDSYVKHFNKINP